MTEANINIPIPKAGLTHYGMPEVCLSASEEGLIQVQINWCFTITTGLAEYYVDVMRADANIRRAELIEILSTAIRDPNEQVKFSDLMESLIHEAQAKRC